MTVCLGALCAGIDGKEASAVVVTSDRTMGGITALEHEVPKLTQIGERIAARATGDALRGAHLINGVRRYAQQGAQPLQNVAATAVARHTALRHQGSPDASAPHLGCRPAGASCRTARTPHCDGAPRCPTTSRACACNH